VELVIGAASSLVLLGVIAFSYVTRTPLQVSHVLILTAIISATIGIDILRGGKPPGEI